MNTKFLEYSKKDNTLMTEVIVNGAITRLRLLVNCRTVATDLLDVWEDSRVELQFNTDGWLREIGNSSGELSSIIQLVYRGQKRWTRKGPRHLILSGVTSEDEGFHIALVYRGVGKYPTPGTKVANLLVNHLGEVCEIVTEPSMEVKEVRPRTTEG